MKKILLLLTSMYFITSCAQDPSEQKKDDINISTASSYSFEIVVPDLIIPWGLDFLPDSSMIITEKSGEIIHFKNGEKTTISGGPDVWDNGQGGLLDVKVHPDFNSTKYIYFTYSSKEGEEDGAHTALMRAKLDGNQLIEQEVLYKAGPNTTKGQHFGSRILFDDNGHVFFSIGERGARDENPQDITRDGGKIYRLNLDGSIPNDNPFVNTSDAKKAIWSYGHRNPQGMAWHPDTHELWVHEHGPRGGDEINVIKKGANYGWPVITYGINYSGTTITDATEKEGMEQPLYYWTPSIAPCGMTFVKGTTYPELENAVLAGSLKFLYLEALHLDKNNQVVKREKILDGVGRVRNVKQAPDGTIYLGVEGRGILKLIKE